MFPPHYFLENVFKYQKAHNNEFGRTCFPLTISCFPGGNLHDWKLTSVRRPLAVDFQSGLTIFMKIKVLSVSVRQAADFLGQSIGVSRDKKRNW